MLNVRLLVALLVPGVLALGGFSARSQAPAAAPTPLAEISKVTDPKTRAALEEIARKVADIREVVVQSYISNAPTGTVRTTSPRQLILRVDGFAFMHVDNLGGKKQNILIQEEWIFNNHKQYWVVQKGTDTVTNKAVTIASLLDLTRLERAGVKSAMSFNSQFAALLNPFVLLDPSRLKLVEETPDAWTFSADFTPQGVAALHLTDTEGKLERLSISKKTGLLVKSETSGAQPVIESLSQVTVNPDPPMPEKYYTYTPPADALVYDLTGGMIQEHVNATNQKIRR